MTRRKAKGGWSADEIAAYERFLAEREAEERAWEEMQAISGAAQLLERELEAVVHQLLGKMYVAGLGARVKKSLRPLLRDRLVRSLSVRYEMLMSKRRAEGVSEASAHRATLMEFCQLSIEHRALRRLRRPDRKGGLLEAYERWVREVKPAHREVKARVKRTEGGDATAWAKAVKAELCMRMPGPGRHWLESEKIVFNKGLRPPRWIAVRLACREIGVTLSAKRAYEEVRRQHRQGQRSDFFTAEELEASKATEVEEERLKALRDSFGAPAGLRDLWA